MASSVLENPPTAAAQRAIQKIVLPGETPLGEPILAVLVKRTYDIVPGGRCVRAAADRKVTPADVHYDDPMNSTVKCESDLIPFKIATDVVLQGKAYAPAGQRATTLTASLLVGQYRKDLSIFGDRVARFNGKRDPIFTDPQPFQTMDLRYERAYGGVDIYSEPKMQCIYPRNHLGRGYVVANTQRSVENLPLPNIEDPAKLLAPAGLCVGDFQGWERQPVPQGFGWTQKAWLPRASFAGVMPSQRALEKELREAYSTLVPPGQREKYANAKTLVMDFRFFNGASPGLVLPFLAGDEPVTLLNLDPQGKLEFLLPGERPKVSVDLGQGAQEPPVVLHTVMIRMEERQVDLLWRCAVPYGGLDSLPGLKKMDTLIL
jgi:hypothetical protein